MDIKTDYYWNQVRKNGARYEGFNWALIEFVFSFIYANNSLATFFQKIFSQFGISPAASNAMAILKHAEQGCTQQRLSQLLLSSRANVTKILDGLEKKGLVKRTSTENDRREHIVKLTEKGDSLMNVVIPHHHKSLANLMAGFSKKEIEIFKNLLQKFRTAILENGK